jgi:uncharacterized iron-regulated membrane protein
VLLVIALTGLVWGFPWFNDAVYWVVSGGAGRPAVVTPDSTAAPGGRGAFLGNVDLVWRRLTARHPAAEVLIVCLPSTSQAAIRCIVNPDRRTYWKTDHYYFDQYSAAEIPVTHSWGKFQNATAAAVVRRLNYDVHIGAVAGLPGKLIVFLASLIAATLPVTGALIWWGKGQPARAEDEASLRPVCELYSGEMR